MKGIEETEWYSAIVSSIIEKACVLNSEISTKGL